MTHTIEYAKEHFAEHGFSQYSNAYVATNEDLRNTLVYMPKQIGNALTVAGSGDHPMFTTLYGAKHVDTFDISFNARLIMDIKTNALSLLNYEEYCELLKQLYMSKDILKIKKMPKIIKKLSSFEQAYITEMREKPLFNKQLNFSALYFPIESEFQQMKQLIKEPFNFIWSDLQTLNTKLTKTYDFIHLSNIFDYIGKYQNCIDILSALTPYTNPGCNICVICFNKDKEAICNNFVWDQNIYNRSNQVWIASPVSMLASTCILHRIR